MDIPFVFPQSIDTTNSRERKALSSDKRVDRTFIGGCAHVETLPTDELPNFLSGYIVGSCVFGLGGSALWLFGMLILQCL